MLSTKENLDEILALQRRAQREAFLIGLFVGVGIAASTFLIIYGLVHRS